MEHINREWLISSCGWRLNTQSAPVTASAPARMMAISENVKKYNSFRADYRTREFVHVTQKEYCEDPCPACFRYLMDRSPYYSGVWSKYQYVRADVSK